MGFVPGLKNKSLQERERISKANLDTVHTSTTMAVVLTVTYNLRNVGGQNFVTPIRDQGNCGFCVAFGTVATVEGRSRTQANNPNPNVDLSEAHLFYCYGFNDGKNCQNGWWPAA
jgi:C1A family cysteine protease